MEQPHTGPSPSGSKMCWSCTETTPYDQGFCAACWKELPEPVQRVFNYADVVPHPYRGLLNAAIVHGLQVNRSLARRPSLPSRTKPVDLGKLELDL